VPWAVLSWGRAGACCFGSEDPASYFQPEFFHGQFKRIIPVQMLCSSLATLRPPRCSSSQCARRERAPVPSSCWGTWVSLGPPRRDSRIHARGAEPSSPPQLLPLHPKPARVPAAGPGVGDVPSLSPEPPRGDMIHTPVPIAMAMGARCPPPHRVALNEGPNKIKRSNRPKRAGDMLLTSDSCGLGVTATSYPSRIPQGCTARPCTRSRYGPGMLWKGCRGRVPSLPPPCGNPFLEMKDSAEAEPGSGALQGGNWFPC